MYAYDPIDKAIVAARVAEFRDQVARRLSGALSEEEFKPLRLMNGLYLQLHAYMLRVAIPYGTLSSAQMRKLAHIAEQYDKGYGHFTTRQNIQYNWPKLIDTPDILAALATVEMHAIQTSGNCIRNVTTDEFAGASFDEIADPRPYAELIRQWSSLHPEFSFLPRKFKIAISASAKDRAAVRWHDIGLEMRVNDKGARGFAFFVGGGMGRTPVIARLINDFIPEAALLNYLEAILRVYNEAGRRDNKYKARLKILLDAMGEEAFRAAIDTEKQRIDAARGPSNAAPSAAIAAEQERLKNFFPAPDFQPRAETIAAEIAKTSNKAYKSWLIHNLHPHKIAGYTSVIISLKKPGAIPGDATSAQMNAVAALSEAYSMSEIRVSHSQNLVLPHVAVKDLNKIYGALEKADLASANIGLLSDIIACPGLDYCSLANARSIPLAQSIARHFHAERAENIGPLKIKISGCINSCGHHHAGHIGILGVDRRGEENYQILLGGSDGNDAQKAELLGPGFTAEKTIEAIEKIIHFYEQNRQENESFLHFSRRRPSSDFKDILYANAS